MRKMLIGVFLMSACGKDDALVQSVRRSEINSPSSPERSVGLFGVTGDGRSVIKQSYYDMPGLKENSHKAFNSFVRYQVRNAMGATETCAGVFAYVPIPDTVNADLYFYTAKHCLERRHRFGIKLGKNHIIANSAVSFLWDPANAGTISPRDSATHPYSSRIPATLVNVVINLSSEKLIELTSAGSRESDVIRFKQKTASIRELSPAYLPVCPSTFEADDLTPYLQAVGFRDRESDPYFLYYANIRRVPEDPRLFPVKVQEALSYLYDGVSLGRAVGVRVRAGDSGGPVFYVRGAVDKLTGNLANVNGHRCVFGLLSRQIVVPADSDAGASSLIREGLYTRIVPAGGGVWTHF